MAIIIIREATTGVVLAQADETAVVRVENGLYFHPDTVEQGYLVVTDRTYN